MNGYPKSFITHTARRSSGRCQEKISEGECERKPKATVTLPYVRGVSENIKRMLEKANVRVRMKPHKTLRQMLVKPKDPTLNHHQIGVVYRVPCRDCPQAYIGQSGRTLQCRMKEHKRAVEQGNTETSAVAEHAWNNDHRVDWEAVEVLDMNYTEWYKRCVVESWHIQSEPAAMNRDQGIMPQIYRTLQ